MGVTTVRDLGNDAQTLAARMARFEAGTEIGPRLLRAGLIDGPGELAAPTGILAGNEAEARAAVTRLADAGYQQVKLYSSLDPKLVPVIAKEAHKRGLRVSGHIPQGMIASQAVRAGFDEIQHGNMLFLEFLWTPEHDTRTPARFHLVANGGADLDLGGKQVKAFLDLLAARKTVLDPTLVTFEGMFGADQGDLDPALAAYAGRLPSSVERYARTGGLAVTDAAQRARFRAAHAAMGRFIKLAWDRRIPIVAGTDATAGLTLSRELELYVAAGIPAADVLAIATIGAARVMGRDQVSGSIRAGKQADLVLVGGDPTKNIGDVRNTDVVIARGRTYDPAALLRAAGMKPR
jgi:imidazolonepropionase-like amidohydrolase